jgi:N-acetylgalactosamine-6-sulfatase
MNRYLFLLTTPLFCTTPSTSVFSQPKADPKPNIVLILADDMGYGDLGSYGCPDIKTPNLDRLANQGVRFTQFYANGPECSPTRAALLSGRYQQRVGGLECAIGAGNIGRYDEAKWLSDQRDLGLPADHCTLPTELKKAGYNTAIIGKWHLGYEPKFRPDKQGFDYSIGPIGFGGDYFYHVEKVPINQPDFKDGHNLAENGKEVFRNGEYITELITSEAKSWLSKQSAEKPFFLYLPFTSPHDPYQGPNDRIGRPLQGEEWNFKSREKYIEMVEAMDKGIGEILAALDKNNQAKETIVIFFSDNGGTGIANNGILSGFKGQVYEGGIRVPCIIRWPGKVAANTVSTQTAMSIDLSRSILEIAGVKTSGLKLDGYDILKHVLENKNDIDRTMFWRAKRNDRVRKAVREGDLKYIIETDKGLVSDEKLFNLKNDPSELTDLFLSYQEKAKDLQQKIVKWEADVAAPRLRKLK